MSRIIGSLLVLAAVSSTFAQAPPRAAGPSESDNLFRSGIASLQAMKFAEAEAAFRKVLELEPANVSGPFGVAQVYMAQGKVMEAVKVLEEAAGKNSTRPEFFAALGDVAFRGRYFDFALEQFQKALALLDFKTSGTFYMHRGTFGVNPAADAVNAILGPDDTPKGAAGLEVRIGEVFNAKGDSQAAIAALRKAHELQPQNAMILAGLGLYLETAGKKTEAIAAYREAVQIDPKQAVVLNNLAYLLSDNEGDLYEALRLARRAQLLQPALPEIADTVAWISLKQGWVDDAFAGFRDIVRKQPANRSFREHLVATLEKMDKHDPRTEELKTALKAEPSESNNRQVIQLLQDPPK